MMVALKMTGYQANDLRLLCRVARSLTLPVLVARTTLSEDEANEIADRLDDVEVTLHKALR